MNNSYHFNSASDLLKITKLKSIDLAELSKISASNEYNKEKSDIEKEMRKRIEITKESILFGLNDDTRTPSGLSGGDAKKLNNQNNSIVGNALHKSLVYSIAITEANAKHARVVAFPTAGASGVVPATLIGFCDNYDLNDSKLTNAYFVSGILGVVIAENASLSGAYAGCQAEIGSAGAMAAGGLAYLLDLETNQILDAAAIALKSMLGLVCDPIAGLVECPCIKRNTFGVSAAYTAVELVKSGITSNVPLDEVISAMKEIGLKMNPIYKETSEGGIAATKTGKIIWQKVFGKSYLSS